MKTFKDQFNEGFAYASGRWGDFIIDRLVHRDKSLRIYVGKRKDFDTQLFETQVMTHDGWKTVQYSTTMEEALHPQKQPAPYSDEQVKTHQRMQPWYKRARGREYTDEEIFGENINSNPEAAISEINSLGIPMDRPGIVLIGGVKVNIKPYDDNTISLNTIEAQEEGKGAGTKVLRAILDIANRNNVSVYVDPMPFGKMPNKSLIEWYKKHGFVRGTQDFEHGLIHYPVK